MRTLEPSSVQVPAPSNCATEACPAFTKAALMPVRMESKFGSPDLAMIAESFETGNGTRRRTR